MTTVLIIAVLGNASAWTQFKGSPEHSGGAPAIDPNPGTMRWRFITGAEIHSSAAISENGTVYITSLDGNLYALDGRGNRIWSYDSGSRIWTSPAISSSGAIHFVDEEGTLHAIGVDGRSLWKFRSREEVYHSSASIDKNDNIYFGTAGGTLYCIRGDGVPKWAYKAGGHIDASPSVSSDLTVYFGSGDGKVHAVGPFGRPKWDQPYSTGGSVSSSVCIAQNGDLHISSSDGYVHNVLPNGTFVRKVRVGDVHLSSPSTDSDGNIYVGTMAGDLVRIDVGGYISWRFTTNGAVESSPIVTSDDRVLFGSVDGNLYCIDTEGSLQWSFEVGDWIESSSCAVDADGTIYMAGGDGILYCIGTPYPQAPMFLTAAPLDGAINLSWSPSEDVLSYRLYRSVNDAPFALLQELNGSMFFYMDSGLKNGQAYSYRISAVNSVGEGPFSNIVTEIPYARDPINNGEEGDKTSSAGFILVVFLIMIGSLLLLWNLIPNRDGKEGRR